MAKDDNKLNEVDKIASLAAEIEIAEKDADSSTNEIEIDWYHNTYLPPLYKELYDNFNKLTKKLIHSTKQPEYRYQLL